MILTAKPDVVIVELDQERLETLQRLAPSGSSTGPTWRQRLAQQTGWAFLPW